MRNDLIGDPYPEGFKNSINSADISANDIAIVGMDCNFPGGDGVMLFWESLLQGKSAINEVPGSRWDSTFYFDSENNFKRMNTNKGGFIASIDHFDPDFFGISSAEAEYMDPQQRLLLQTSWTALENSGISPSELEGSLTGVFIGSCSHEFSLMAWSEAQSIYTATGNSNSILANRLSYYLKLNGPSISVDTACSSSLVALHLAKSSLISGECDYAIVGGTNVMITPMVTVGLSQAGMISSHGECRAFGDNAEGYVRGEGVGVVILMRAMDAIKKHLPVVCLIRGSAVNHNGKSNGLTAPNPAAQESLFKLAYNSARIRFADVDYLESAATGTQYGDAIEMKAIAETFLQERSSAEPLIIGSVKSNIGHLEGAAGVAAIIKTALVVKNGIVPRNLHSETLNPLVKSVKGHFVIPQENTALLDKPVCWGAVNSFGFGGTNAHVVLSSFHQYAAAPVNDEREKILFISAKNEVRLAELIQHHLHTFNSDSNINLENYSYTINTGREQLNHRFIVKYSDRLELIELLKDHQRVKNFIVDTSTGLNRFILGLSGSCIAHHEAIRALCSFSDALNSEFDAFIKYITQENKIDIPGFENVKNAHDVFDFCVSVNSESQRAKIFFEFLMEYCVAKWMIGFVKNVEGFLAKGLGVVTALCINNYITLDDAIKWLLGAVSANNIEFINNQTVVNIRFDNSFFCNAKGESLDVLTHRLLVKEGKWLFRAPVIFLDQPSIQSAILVAEDQLEKSTYQSNYTVFNWGKSFEDFVLQIALVGAGLNFRKLYSPGRYSYLVAPNYPFDKKRYWPEHKSMNLYAGAEYIPGTLASDFCGKKIFTGLTRSVHYDYTLNLKNSKFIRDHVILGKNILSASTQVAMVLSCLRDVSPEKDIVLEHLEFSGQILIDSDVDTHLQLVVAPYDDKQSGQLHIFVNSGSDSWDQVFGCLYSFHHSKYQNHLIAAPTHLPEEIRYLLGTKATQHFLPLSADFYKQLRADEYGFGSSFRYLTKRNEILPELFELFQSADANISDSTPLLPGSLDAAFQSLLLVAEQGFADAEKISIPVSIAFLRLCASATASSFKFSYIDQLRQEENKRRANFSLLNENVEVLLELKDVSFKSFVKKELIEYWNRVGEQNSQQPSDELELLKSGRSNRVKFFMSLMYRVLGRVLDDPELNESMVSLGVDSLKSMEIRAVVKKYFSIDIPVAKIMGGISAHEILCLLENSTSDIDNKINLDAANHNVMSRITFSDESSINTKIMETDI